LWSPGNPLFPAEPISGEVEKPALAAFQAILARVKMHRRRERRRPGCRW
jgi:hypothetical protein